MASSSIVVGRAETSGLAWLQDRDRLLAMCGVLSTALSTTAAVVMASSEAKDLAGLEDRNLDIVIAQNLQDLL